MSFGEEMGWKSWKDIRDWCSEKGYKHLAKRMNLNNECWMSSGEFGRSQAEICDSLRLASDEDEAKEIAAGFDEVMKENYGLW